MTYGRFVTGTLELHNGKNIIAEVFRQNEEGAFSFPLSPTLSHVLRPLIMFWHLIESYMGYLVFDLQTNGETGVLTYFLINALTGL